MLSKKQILAALFLFIGINVCCDQPEIIQQPMEDSCLLGASARRLSFCQGLFKQACAGTTEENALAIFLRPEEKDEIYGESKLKAARATTDLKVYESYCEIINNRAIIQRLKQKQDNILRYYEKLKTLAKEKEKQACIKGFYVPSDHLPEFVCNDTRLIQGDNGTGLNSIVNILFEKTSPVRTTFGYVAALEAISTPTDKIDKLVAFQNKLKCLLTDAQLMDQLDVILSKMGKLEYAYFCLDKMPEPEPYNPNKYKSYADWQYKVQSRTFVLNDWGNVGGLDKFSPGLYQAQNMFCNLFTPLVNFSAVAFLLFQMFGVYGLTPWAKLKFKGLYQRVAPTFGPECPTGWKRTFTPEYWEPYNKIVENWKGDILPLVGVGLALMNNKWHYHCAINKFFTILWAKNLCVDLKNFLKLAIELEQKASYVGIGDGKSISHAILHSPDKELAECLSALLDSDMFDSKCDLESFKALFHNFGKVIYILVYLTDKNNKFLTEIVRRVGEIDYTVATAKLVWNTKDQENGFRFVDFYAKDVATIDCQGTWDPFVDPLVVVPNDIYFGQLPDSKSLINGYILTGGNGTGKSCFSSSLIISLICGQTLTVSPVQKMKFTPFEEILTYVKVEADPVKGQSLFMAQMDSVGKMAARVGKAKEQNKKIFLFMDESLSGTNWMLGTAFSQAIVFDCFINQKHLSLMFNTHLDILARTCEKRSGGTIRPIKIDCEADSNGMFLRSKHKVVPGVSTLDSAFSIAQNQWSEYPFCEDVIQTAHKEFKALKPIEKFAIEHAAATA